ncbi:hypothetical protein [Hydrogenophaga sp. PBL-H3]|uniref:hypothetical protein n=1 Tax=Hydrogenophaga sp. PBL-H3 TaxID=434010 RepID=UPI00131FCD90|nr:hypothetical protein [Hydrogenophaga sp. PBL-H3]QHE76785.1 hypothetical protein F9Z45_12305 [Hydrogenophaga sp. PBL-H3]QHE81209.1 hypothetical protein F9Z44_12305 [Hydrogenophaga sp. PBL-H3]
MIGVLSVGLLAACSGPSSEEVKTYSEACVDFYKEKRAKSSDDVEYRKHWMKDDKIVIALKVERRGESGYAEGICVVDPEEGTVHIPSLFDQARWAN